MFLGSLRALQRALRSPKRFELAPLPTKNEFHVIKILYEAGKKKKKKKSPFLK